MMLVLRAAFRESLAIGAVRRSVDEARLRTTTGDALALEVSDMFGKGQSNEAPAAMARS
jgi:hypothetical protein